MLEKENQYYNGGYPLATYRKNVPTSMGYSYNNNNPHGARERSSPAMPYSYESVPLPPSFVHQSSALDSLEDMLHVGSERHRGSRRASPQRVPAPLYRDPVTMRHSPRAVPSASVGPADMSGWVGPMPSPAPTAASNLAADLYVLQLEQEVEALTLDCQRVSGRLCTASAAQEQRALLMDEVLARRGLEQAEQQSVLALWGLHHSTSQLRQEAQWRDQVRAAQWKQTAAEERASALTASKAGLERQVERLEQQLAAANSPANLSASVAALFKAENDKIASLLEQVPARVCTEMSAATAPPPPPPPHTGTSSAAERAPSVPTATATAAGVDPQLRGLIESLAEQLRQRTLSEAAALSSSPSPSPAVETSSASPPAAASIPAPQLARLVKSAVSAMEAISDAYLRASTEKLRYVEYEMQVAQLVHHKQDSITWATRNEDLRTENRRLQENIHSLRTQLKVALDRDVTPSASLIFNTYGGSGEKRAKLYAQYASPYIPPSLELTAAPAQRTAADLRDEAIKLGARPATFPAIRADLPPVSSSSTAPVDAASSPPAWQFATNVKRDANNVYNGASGTFSLPSHHTDSPPASGDDASDDSEDDDTGAERAKKPAAVAAPTAAASPAARVSVMKTAETSMAAPDAEVSTTIVATLNASEAGTSTAGPQVKRFTSKDALGTDSSTSDSSSSAASSSDSDDDVKGRKKAAPKPSGAASAPQKTAASVKAAPAAVVKKVVLPALQRTNASTSSSSLDTSTDSSDDATNSHGSPSAARKPSATATATAVRKLSKPPSVDASLNAGKGPSAAASPKTAATTTAKSAPKPAPALKRRNSFDDDSSDDDNSNGGGEGSYTYSYSSTASGKKPAAAKAVAPAPATKARRSSFDDEDEEAKPAKAGAKPSSNKATPAPAKAPAPASPTTPAASASAASAKPQPKAVPAKTGGLKLPSW